MTKRMINKLIRPFLPTWVNDTVASYRILSIQLGHLRSLKKKKCLDRNDNPLPLYSYPAINYINQLDLTTKSVFEYGAGYSTLFWAQRVRSLVTVEHDEAWYNKIKREAPTCVDLLYFDSKEEYVKSIERCMNDFDMIIIDGIYRYECATAAVSKLAKDGFLILDDSDSFPKTSNFLRLSNLIEVDMAGFSPSISNVKTTSFYFSRSVNTKPAAERQPMHSVGSFIHIDEAERD